MATVTEISPPPVEKYYNMKLSATEMVILRIALRNCVNLTRDYRYIAKHLYEDMDKPYQDLGEDR